MQNKAIFTTGEVANLLHIHQTTVIDWIDKGMIQSYKTPGGHRRVSKESLFSFLAEHNMPLPSVLMNNHGDLELEKHRHVHESFQANPYSQSKPADVFPTIPKSGFVKNNAKKARLAQKSK